MLWGVTSRQLRHFHAGLASRLRAYSCHLFTGRGEGHPAYRLNKEPPPPQRFIEVSDWNLWQRLRGNSATAKYLSFEKKIFFEKQRH